MPPVKRGEDALIPWGETVEDRPRVYPDDCRGRPRPCPWVGCKAHLFVDVHHETGSLIYNIGRKSKLVEYSTRSGRPRKRKKYTTPRLPSVPTRRPKANQEMADRNEEKVMEAFHQALLDGRPTCLFDMVDDNSDHTLEEVGELLNLTRERVRQIEVAALQKLKRGEEDAHALLAGWNHKEKDEPCSKIPPKKK